jgi:hypothetical protein
VKKVRHATTLTTNNETLKAHAQAEFDIVVSALETIILEFRKDFNPAYEPPEPEGKSDVPGYNLERDIKAHVINLERDESLSELGVMKGVSAGIHDDVFKGQFPNQRVSVEKILHMSYRDQIWTETKKGDTLRYVHFPCNNMSVSSPEHTVSVPSLT